jgi:hypothetical protein
MADSSELHQVMVRAVADPDATEPTHRGGYANPLRQVAGLDPVVLSFYREARRNYKSRCFKATVVLVGSAVERIVLGIRDAVVQQITHQEQPVPKPLLSWQIATVFDAVTEALRPLEKQMSWELQEALEIYWPALLDQVRASRHAAWHPKGIDTVGADAARAALVLFPELARLGSEVREFVREHYHSCSGKAAAG